MSWFQLLFTDGREFLGSCFVESATEIEAVSIVNKLDLNPGGDVEICEVAPSDQSFEVGVPDADRERFLDPNWRC
jgi:hypothetical protein